MPRSRFLRDLKIASTIALFASFLAPAQLHASAPMVKTNGPGFYRFMLGDFEVTVLTDGTFSFPVKNVLANVSPAQIDHALADSFLASPYQMSVNTFLINTGSKLVLIDTGLGSISMPGSSPESYGHLLANLKASGYAPDQIDEIYITHFHPDHIGNLLHDGKITFPNAIVRYDKHEADFWLSPENIEKYPTTKALMIAAQQTLEPYIQAGHAKPFDGSTELAPGIRAVEAFGHTPGHTMYLVESKGQKLLVWGDIMHVQIIQFAHPEVTLQYDSDSKTATAMRAKVFAEAAREGYLVGGAHLFFPGVGHIRAEGNGYVFVPLAYAQIL
jgi:glyoxylase-like metal-dependent hydrolase (beta-lactamase superfamily II)